MMFEVVIEFAPDRDPVRREHGLRRLLEFAQSLAEREAALGVRRLVPIVWGCEEPISFARYDAPDEQTLRELVSGIHNTLNVRIVPCKNLAEVIALAGPRLADMRRAAPA